MSARRINYNSDFWQRRADDYNKLEWANHRLYLNELIRMGKFRKTDIVLDVGTGTGIVAHEVAPFVKEVIGLDKSQDMLEHSNWYGNMYFIKRDILTPIFKDGVFDKVIARQVFHHILRRTQQAMKECYRVLKPGGLMVFSEGVPPSPEVKQDYIEIFKRKEKRLTFMEADLTALMGRAGFENIRVNTVWLRRMSVRNWLSNSGLPQSFQDEIFELHVNAKDYFKRAYNMVEADEDCLIDMKMIILSGKK